jgi:hypothetical protein
MQEKQENPLITFCSITRWLETSVVGLSSFCDRVGYDPNSWWSCWLIGEVSLEATNIEAWMMVPMTLQEVSTTLGR